jgi:hypothetical protein
LPLSRRTPDAEWSKWCRRPSRFGRSGKNARVLTEFHASPDEAEASIAHGEGIEITRVSIRALAEDVKRRGRARIAAENQAPRSWLITSDQKRRPFRSHLVQPLQLQRKRQRRSRRPSDRRHHRAVFTFLATIALPGERGRMTRLGPGRRSFPVDRYVIV